ncbi:hypothetical protein Pelo_17740 [Pelomyxa schiedti]|nr:hypothetical protein Pelo_17740 [Pelomyxa schiedti]
MLAICRKLNGRELQRLAVACKALYNCICGTQHDSLWAHLCFLDFGIIPATVPPLQTASSMAGDGRSLRSDVSCASSSAVKGGGTLTTGDGKTLVAFSSAPRVASAPLRQTPQECDGMEVDRRMVWICAQGKGGSTWQSCPDPKTWQMIGKTLVDRFYATSESNLNKILCWYFKALTWAPVLCFEMENEADSDSFYQWLYTGTDILVSSFPSDHWFLELCKRGT